MFACQCCCAMTVVCCRPFTWIKFLLELLSSFLLKPATPQLSSTFRGAWNWAPGFLTLITPIKVLLTSSTFASWHTCWWVRGGQYCVVSGNELCPTFPSRKETPLLSVVQNPVLQLEERVSSFSWVWPWITILGTSTALQIQRQGLHSLSCSSL